MVDITGKEYRSYILLIGFFLYSVLDTSCCLCTKCPLLDQYLCSRIGPAIVSKPETLERSS